MNRRALASLFVSFFVASSIGTLACASFDDVPVATSDAASPEASVAVDAAQTTDAGSGDAGAVARRIYIFGGSISTDTRAIYALSAEVKAADGSLGDWEPEPALNVGRFHAAFVASPEGALLVAGGHGSITATNDLGYLLQDVKFATLDPLQPFADAPSLPTGRAVAAGFAAGGRLYVAGGDLSATSQTDEILVATPGQQSLTSWEVAGKLPTAIADQAMAVIGPWVYVIGGSKLASGDAGRSTPVESLMAPIDGSTGTVGTWTSAGTPQVAGKGSAAVVSQNRVIVIGGANASDVPYAAVLAGAQNANGTLSWKLSTPLPAAVVRACAVISGDRIYVLGGNATAAGVSTPLVYIGRLGKDGTLEWTTEKPMPTARLGAGCAIR